MLLQSHRIACWDPPRSGLFRVKIQQMQMEGKSVTERCCNAAPGGSMNVLIHQHEPPPSVSTCRATAVEALTDLAE
jgi:hypothetical protein